MSVVLDFFVRLGDYLVDEAYGRYDWLSRFLDYVGGSTRRRFASLVLGGIAGAFAFPESWYWSVLTAFCYAGVWMALGVNVGRWLIGFWEFIAWTGIARVLLVLGSLALGYSAGEGLVTGTLQTGVFRLAEAICYTYFLCDLRQPPRKRKKIKLPAMAPAKVEWRGEITSVVPLVIRARG